MTEPSLTGPRASRPAGPRRPAEGRLRLLAAAEQLFATRGLGVPNREIVAAAGQHNSSAITYHFASRAGLIDAVCEHHETPIAQHREYLITRLHRPEGQTTRQLVDAYVQPLVAEMLRYAPSYWARFNEMLLADQPAGFSRGIEPAARPRPTRPADPAMSELLELMMAHLSHLPEPEALGRVALTVRFLNSGLARWERDSQAGAEGITPLASYMLILTDLAIAMLDSPSSAPPRARRQASRANQLRLRGVPDGMMCLVTEAVTDCLPPAFVDCLLDSALEPVLDAAVRRGGQAASRKRRSGQAAEVAKALLAVTVCDPACGSGSLLAAAAHRIARRVAEAREGNQSPDALRRAMREVVGSCIYGVDVSGAAVERTKDRLRLAADVPGMSPPFLDGRIRPGNALIGASPDLIESGIPDEAFRTADGDDRRLARVLRRANARPDPGQATLFSVQGGYSHSNEALAKSLAKTGRPSTQARAGQAPADDRHQAAEYQQWRDSAAFREKRLVADAWCAAFAWAKTPDAPPAIVNRVLLDLRERGAEGVLPETLAEIGRLRDEHLFFHWHLEFPDVFRVSEGETRWRGGFSCVLSAPPREKIDRHGVSTAFRFATGSGAYPGCVAGLAEPGVSALRTDQLFTERALTILAPEGRAGGAVAPGTAAAPGARHLLGGLMRCGVLASLYDFDSPGARSCLLTLVGDGESAGGRGGAAHGGAGRFAFRLDGPADLADSGRSFTLTPGEVALINPNTGALPPFLGARDAALVTAVYRRVPALWDEARPDGNPWKMRLETAFPRAAADTGLLRAEQELRADGWELAESTLTRDGQYMLPVYEPPMVDLFDHRVAKPRYWVAARGPVAVQRKDVTAQRPGVTDRLAELGWNWEWLCAWRMPVPDRPVPDRPVPDRTAVAVFLPRAATAGSLPLMLPRVVPPFAAALIAAQSSLVFDYVARQKIDGPAVRAAAWKQLPVPTPGMLEPHLPFIVPRVLELVYTAADMRPLARDLDDAGDPFAWDADRRASLRAELDAFFFRLYGIDARDDVEYITGAPQEGVGRREGGESTGDGGRARKLVLAAFDRMSEADAAGAGYETRIFPPPGHGRRHHPRSEEPR